MVTQNQGNVKWEKRTDWLESFSLGIIIGAIILTISLRVGW